MKNEFTYINDTDDAPVSTGRKILRLLAYDNWFRIVSFPTGRPDMKTLWLHGALAMAWFLLGCLAMCGGYYLWWPIFFVIPFAGWKVLEHWSRTFYMRLRGENRFLFTNYGHAFTGICRTFILLWAVYLATTPLRPLANSPVPAEMEPDAATIEKTTAALPDDYFAIGCGLSSEPGPRQWLASPFGAWLIGCDKPAQRQLIANRRAWYVALDVATPDQRAAVLEAAKKAEWSHPVLGRGGLPFLCDMAFFYSRFPVKFIE